MYRMKSKKSPNSKVYVCALLMFIFLVGLGFSEAPDEVKQFIAGSIADKTRIILRLDLSQPQPERVNVLPKTAIEFVLANKDDLGDSAELENLFLAALGKLQNGAQELALLNSLLEHYATGRAASAILALFYDYARLNPAQMKQTVPVLNGFLLKNTALLSTNADPVRAAIRTLSLCGDSSSFRPLLVYAMQTRDTETSALALDALLAITDGFEQNALQIIAERPVSEKLYIFRIIQQNDKISSEFKAKSAENALSQAITIARDNNMISGDLIALQTEALNVIVHYEWTQASSLVLSLFPVAQREDETSVLREDKFIQALQANASLGVSGAGRVLSNYLAVLNAITEQYAGNSATKPVSAAVVLALIHTLGTLGDKTAFDNLLYVTYLDYDTAVIQSAREALAKLKW
jgi:hypothetical protein